MWQFTKTMAIRLNMERPDLKRMLKAIDADR